MLSTQIGVLHAVAYGVIPLYTITHSARAVIARVLHGKL